jgi:hypothetical protein
MSWVKAKEPIFSPEQIKQLQGTHPFRPTPGPADFDTLPAFTKTSRYKNPRYSNFGQETADRFKTSALGRRLSKGAAEPGRFPRHSVGASCCHLVSCEAARRQHACGVPSILLRACRELLGPTQALGTTTEMSSARTRPGDS